MGVYQDAPSKNEAIDCQSTTKSLLSNLSLPSDINLAARYSDK